MINIFQFLKQGTSLNRHQHNSNQQLEQNIIPEVLQQNHSYQQTGRFHDSDSDCQVEPEILEPKAIQIYQNRQKQEVQLLSKKQGIKVTGLDCPVPLGNFTKIIHKYSIKEPLVKALGDLGYQRPTAVQMQVLPCLLERRNVIVTAPTGTGKTLSFLLPLLQHLKPTKKIQAVIMVPLQELASQIVQVLQKLGGSSNIKFNCCSKLSPQEILKIQSRKSPGYNILVATPLTFLKLFEGRKALLKQVEFVVLDQCDKCFEESFFQQMKRFLNLFVDLQPTFALFSATIQAAVEGVLKGYLDDCIRVQVGGCNKVLHKIEQSIEYCTNQLGKLIFLKDLITQGKLVPPVLIFVQQKSRARQLYFQMRKHLKDQMEDGCRIEVLSSQKSLEDRQKIIKKFDQGKYWLLIATDLAARGIDFQNVNLVLNYDFPNSMLTYVHRVGRTARAGHSGKAITLFTDQDKPLVRSLANLLKTSGCQLPDWIADMPKAKKQAIKKLQKYPVRRLSVGKATGKDKEWQMQLVKLDKKWAKIKNAQKKEEAEEGWIAVGPEN